MNGKAVKLITPIAIKAGFESECASKNPAVTCCVNTKEARLLQCIVV